MFTCTRASATELGASPWMWNLWLRSICGAMSPFLLVMASSQVSAGERPPVDVSTLPPATDLEVDFVTDVQPILSVACYECHGPDAQEAGLRLDVRAMALAGADSGPVIVPGNSAQSRLIHLAAGLDHETGRMPPEDFGDALTGEQISLLRSWIDRGAEWPDDADGGTRRTSDHWSFQAIAKTEPPIVNNVTWVRNPIDAFIAAELEHEDVTPSPPADRITLLRRVYLDLIGLPPTAPEVTAFVADHRPDAYERVVDHLLASPHYGERWGRHWLDAARYADSDGYEKDLGRPFAWRYRDWVIRAFNNDMPFNAFTVQQLAGDLLTTSDAEYDRAARLATGFHRNTLLNKEGGVDVEEDRVKRTVDRTNTMGTVWLGLSVGCANCHTHKYDPITQREYFGLYAFFNNLEEVDAPVTPDGMATLDPSIRNPQDEKNAQPQPKKPSGDGGRDDVATTLAQTVTELAAPRETYVHLRGDFLSKGPVVQPHTLEVMPPPMTRGSKSDRLDLARWLVHENNPLTARVTVNRLWQTHFGRGIVSTSDDFGTQGEKPSHPELLDWLAAELQHSGWRLKPLHRLIVTSNTYRQSAAVRQELLDSDPYNILLARQNRLRVESEIVRDLALSVSGLLNPAVGGPSIRPPQAAGIADLTYADSAKWIETTGPDRYRRGLYVWFQRTSPFPSMVTFDAPEANLSCIRRERSNTPLQALTLLNDVVFAECANALGKRMMRTDSDQQGVPEDSVNASAEARIRRGFLCCLSRAPSQRELGALKSLYDDTLQICHDDPTRAAEIVGHADGDGRDSTSLAETAACIAVARVLINLDEFLTRE